MAGYTGLFSPTQGLAAAHTAVRSGNYGGSSGYWADGTTTSKPGLGNPGDMARNNINAMNGLAPFNPGAPTNAYNPTQNYFANTGNPSASTALNFQTLSNVKSQPFQDSINNYLTSTNNTSYDPNVNPNVVRSNVKNPALQAAIASFTGNLNSYSNPTDFTKSAQFQSGINQGYGQFQADKGANRGAFGDFANLFASQTPGVIGNTTQENSAIDRTYNGGLAADLQNNANSQSNAVNAATRRAFDTLGRNSALMRLGGGDSSYANQQMLDTGAGINVQAALQKAQLERNNLQYVQQQQQALNNVRNNNLGYVAQRQLQPINALTSLTNSENGQMGQLGAMDLSNNIYTTPQEQGAQRAAFLNSISAADSNNNFYSVDSQQANLARQLGLFGQLQAGNNANNFYGLAAPYQPSTAGFGGSSAYGGPAQRNNNSAPNYFSGYSAPQQQAPTAPSNGLPSYMQGPAYQNGTPEFYAAANRMGQANQRANTYPSGQTLAAASAIGQATGAIGGVPTPGYATPPARPVEAGPAWGGYNPFWNNAPLPQYNDAYQGAF